MRAKEAFGSSQAPSMTLELPPVVWAETWDDRPREPIPVGIRRIAVSDIAVARAESAAQAAKAHPRPGDPAAIDAFYDTLLMWVVARCTCDPEDATRPLALWNGMPEDNAPLMLSEGGARFIYDAYERLTVEQDPCVREASDDEIVRLADVYAEAVAHLDAARSARVRRLLRFVIDELEDAIPAIVDA